MKLLLDTHLLLWAAMGSRRLGRKTSALLEDADNTLFFSAASIWEVAIKQQLAKAEFEADAGVLRRGLLDNGYQELPISSAHAVALTHLPPLHRDPFDRLLVAQAMVEGITLLTRDAALTAYPGPIRKA